MRVGKLIVIDLTKTTVVMGTLKEHLGRLGFGLTSFRTKCCLYERNIIQSVSFSESEY